MVCPVWDGTNLKGQSVCPDSFNTKRRGCNSALDRVLVESNLRPDYSSYVTLNTAGIKGNIFGNPSARQQIDNRNQMLKKIDHNNPNFGTQFESTRRSSGSCSINAYEKAMAQEAQAHRQQGAMNNYATANSYSSF